MYNDTISSVFKASTVNRNEKMILPCNCNCCDGIYANEWLEAIKEDPRHYRIISTGRLPGYTRKGQAVPERCATTRLIDDETDFVMRI